MMPFDVSSTTMGPAPADFCCAAPTAVSATARASTLRRFDKFPHLGDPDLRAHVHEHALRAQRIHRPADVLPPRNEIEVDNRPPSPPRRLVQRVLGLVGRPGL